MSRIKIDYGIDLGTTNSSIARMEKGEPVIKKTKTNGDTLPSCVYFSKNKKGERAIRVGAKAKDSVYSDAIMALNKGIENPEKYGYLEFKREMGSDKRYSNSNMDKAYYTPEELSSEVLKELKSLVLDDNFSAVVITVPAMFTAIQKDATMKAAKMAGFTQCELLQEPIAACMAYGLSNAQKDGRWLVFDFGGGTFDAALVKVEEGILTVFDTEGDNYLGGKNLDEAVVSKILYPHLEKEYDLSSYDSEPWKRQALKDALKGPAEEIRIDLSFRESSDYSTYDRNLNLGTDDSGEEIDLDIHLTRDELHDVIREQYQKAIDTCKELLRRNRLAGTDLTSLILVGGPTFSPLLRDMLREEVTPNVDTSINPMTAVASGAALYASTISLSEEAQSDASKEQEGQDLLPLKINFESTSVENSEWVTLEFDGAKDLSQYPDKIDVILERADGAWRSDKAEVTKSAGNVVEVFLLSGRSNSFEVSVFDKSGNRLSVSPSEFSIIQGLKVSAAPLPYNIGIEVYDSKKERGVFVAAKGLEKNKPIPAVGVVSGKKTMSKLRPGVAKDTLKIPVYQVPGLEAEGKTASLYTRIGDIFVDGNDVNVLIPEDTEIEVTIHVESSEMMSLEAFFPAYDLTVKKDFDLSRRESHEEIIEWTRDQIRVARRTLSRLENEGMEVSALSQELDDVEAFAAQTEDHMRVQSNLKETLRKIEDFEDDTAWTRLEKELREEFERLEKAQNDLGNTQSASQVSALRTRLDEALRRKDYPVGQMLLSQIESLYFDLTRIYQLMGFIRHCAQNFSSISWKNSARARELANMGVRELSGNPTEERLAPIVSQLASLMNDPNVENAGGLLR